MFEDVTGALDQIDDALTSLLGTDLAALDAGTLLQVTRRWETLTRRAGAAQLRLIADVDQRHLAVEHGYPHTAALLHDAWNVAPALAKRRVALARDLAPGRALSGEVLPAVFAQTAAAHDTGTISAEHAQVIITAIDTLPSALAAIHDTAIEARLVTDAALLDPPRLAKLARRVTDHLDPDGVLHDEAHRDRTRDLSIHQRRDGSARITGELTAPCAEKLLTVLDTLARPLPAQDGTLDPRTATQRRHDGLEDALDRVLRTGELPALAGVATTVILTITEEQIRHRTGLVQTGHGALISLTMALKLAADANLIPVVFGAAGHLAAHGTSQRLANPNQRYALIARDKGCTFPGCDAPPGWTQAHHMVDHALGGPTSVANMALVRLSHESCRSPVAVGLRETMRRGRECSCWGSGSAVVDAAVGAGVAA